jgi:hypothetical protein
MLFGCGTRIGKEVDARSRIVVEVEPVRAVVLIDETPMLRTRKGELQSITVEPGLHLVKIEADGYRSHRTELDLEPGEVVNISVELWPLLPELD